MASTLAELLVRLGVDAGAYYREIAKSKREAGQLKEELVGLAKQAAAAFAAYKLVDSVREQVQALDDLDEMAQRTGASIESLSRLKYAADLEGVQDFQGALVKLQKSLLDSSNPASDQAQALKSIGVSARDASGQLRTADQVLIDIAEAFSKAPAGVSKTNVAMALFGKTGAELIPLLNNGADGLKRYADEADRFGLTVDEKAASAAAGFNDDLFRLKAQFEGVSRQVAVGILPQLREFQKTLMDPQFVEAAKTLAGGIVTAFQGAATAIEYTVNVTKWAAESLAALQGGANDLVRIDDRLGEIAERTQKLNEAAAAGAGAWDKLGLSMGETLESSKDRNDRGLAYTIQHELEFLEQERKALLERQKILQMPAKPQAPAIVGGKVAGPTDIEFDPEKDKQAKAALLDLSRARELDLKAAIAAQEEQDRQFQAVKDGFRDQEQIVLDAARRRDEIIRQNAQTEEQRAALLRKSEQQLQDDLTAIQDRASDQRIQHDRDILELMQRQRAEANRDLQNNPLAVLGGIRDVDQMDRLLNQPIREFQLQLAQLGNNEVMTVSRGLGDMAAQAVLFGKGGAEAAKELARSLAVDVVSGLVQIGIQMVAQRALSDILWTAEVSKASASNAAIAASAAPAAAATSLATLGSNSIPAVAGMAAAAAAAYGLFRIAGGRELGGGVYGDGNAYAFGEQDLPEFYRRRSDGRMFLLPGAGGGDVVPADEAMSSRGGVSAPRTYNIINQTVPGISLTSIIDERTGEIINRAVPAISAATEASIASNSARRKGPVNAMLESRGAKPKFRRRGTA